MYYVSYTLKRYLLLALVSSFQNIECSKLKRLRDMPVVYGPRLNKPDYNNGHH